jgi:hypothetical protein
MTITTSFTTAIAIAAPYLFGVETLSQSSNLALEQSSSSIISLINEYSGGDVAQEGTFRGCTFYLQQGEENHQIWRYVIPLHSLHHQSLKNYRLRFDQRYGVPAVILKTAKGKALIEETFLQWTFGKLDSLVTQVASAEVRFVSEEAASRAASAFARAIEICASVNE